MKKKPKDRPVYTKDQIMGGNRFGFVERGEPDTSSSKSPRASESQIKFLNYNGFNFTKDEISRVRAKKLIKDIKDAKKTNKPR